MELLEYKFIAHELIDDIVESGMPRIKVYKKLQYFLDVPKGNEHLGTMSTVGQVKKAIRVLKFLKRKRVIAGKIKRREPREMLLSGHKRKNEKK